MRFEFLVTTSGDNTAKIGDANTGQELQTLLGHTSPVFDVAFKPDNSRLATASADRTMRQHILDNDELRRTIQARLTRGLTLEECQKYLRQKECPPSPFGP